MSVLLKAQSKKIDSLYKVFNSEKQDTAKLHALNLIAAEWGKENLDSAILVGKKMTEVAERIGIKRKIAESYYAYGMGYFLKGDYPTGLKHFLKALHIAEKNSSERFNGQILISVGNSFMMQGEYEKSIEYYEKAFLVFEKNNLKSEMARVYSNIGLVYAYQAKPDKAIPYFKKSLEYREDSPNEAEKAMTYDFMGFAYIHGKKYDEALKYLTASLEINRRVGSPIRVLDNLRNMGECHIKLKNYDLAEKELLESLKIAKDFGHINGVEGNSVLLYELYENKKDFTNALMYYESYINLRDSIYNLENTKSSLQQEIQFEYDKKVAADSVRVVEEKKVFVAKLKQEKTQRYALYGGLSLVGLFALFMVNRFRVINAQKKVIDSQKKIVEEQKNILEEKQKEIMDSIHYAKRIQLSHLPSEKYLVNTLKRLRS
ncbi:MAG: tetratricopeptide repeat protein [Bacteroidia bacterium]|nr:tetratricopeptide repeat protein [Bacteroidia bacterium]